MRNKLSIILGMILLGSIVTNTSKAEAIIYNFNDFNPNGLPSSNTASGFFEIDDLNNDGIADFTGSELVSANINVFDSAGDLLVSGGLDKLVTRSIANVSVNDELLDFSSATGGQLIFNDTNPAFGNFFALNAPGFELIAGGNFGAPCCTLNATADPVAVPFETSPTLGVIILGGIWGVSRLRKKMIARRSASQELV